MRFFLSSSLANGSYSYSQLLLLAVPGRLDNALHLVWDPGTKSGEDLDGSSPFHQDSAPPRCPLLHYLYLQTDFPLRKSTVGLSSPRPFVSGTSFEALIWT